MIERPSGATNLPDWRLIAAIGTMFVARLAIASSIGLTDDEAYYRLWAIAPALSYFDHPPMVGYMIAFSRALLGDTALGVRLVTVVAFCAGAAAFWRAALLLYGPTIAENSCWFLLAMPLLAVGGVIATPDAPSVLFAGLAMWAIAELHRSQNSNWWLAVGIFAGLGLISKYTNAFVGASILIWVLSSARRRQWLHSWQFWVAGAIAAVITSPVIFWNAQHEWASFAKQFGRVVRGQEVSTSYIIEMGAGIFGLASPLIALLAICGLAIATRRTIKHKDAASTLLIASVAPGLVYFAVHAIHSRVQANWLAPMYPTFAMCAAIALETIISTKLQSQIRNASLGVGFASIAAIYAHALSPLPFVNLRKDPTHQMRGWQEFSDGVDALRVAHDAQWIATSSYATTGQLAFGLKSRAAVVQLNQRIRYIHLGPVPAPVVQSPALYVELDRRADGAQLQSRFGSVKRLPDIVRRANGRPVATYAVYRIAEPKSAVFEP